jgi:plasmid stabilization system protein ParE
MHRVILTENAKANLRHYYLRAADNAPETAARWLNRFHEALQTLSTRPERCPLAPENKLVEPEIRQFMFGKRTGCYRALFTI